MDEKTSVIIEEFKVKEKLLKKKYFNILGGKFSEQTLESEKQIDMDMKEVEDRIDRMSKKMETPLDKMDKDVDTMIAKIDVHNVATGDETKRLLVELDFLTNKQKAMAESESGEEVYHTPDRI